MTIEERVELYKSLYKECKALEPVANTLAKGYKQADPRKRLELIRELDTELAEVYNLLKMHNRYLQNDRDIDIIEGNLERVKKKAPPKRCYIRSCKVLAVLHRD